MTSILPAIEIENLHKRMDDREAERLSKKTGSENDDNALATMGEMEGWKIYRGLLEQKICDYLEPVEYGPEVPLDVRGAINDSRCEAIKVLRSALSIVEIPRLALKAIAKDSSEEGKEDKKP